MALEMSLLATSLMLYVALLGCGDFAYPTILHPPAVPVHAACAFVICDQCVCFDPGGALLIAAIASYFEASGGVDPVSLDALDMDDDDSILISWMMMMCLLMAVLGLLAVLCPLICIVSIGSCHQLSCLPMLLVGTLVALVGHALCILWWFLLCSVASLSSPFW